MKKWSYRRRGSSIAGKKFMTKSTETNFKLQRRSTSSDRDLKLRSES